MILSSIRDFLIINEYFYKSCIIDYDTSYKFILTLFDDRNKILILDDVYNLYLAVYLLPRLISPLTFSKLKISNEEYYNRYINLSLRKCFINKEIHKKNKIFINNLLNLIDNKK